MIDRAGCFLSGNSGITIFSLSIIASRGFSLELSKIAFCMVFDNYFPSMTRNIQSDLSKSLIQANTS